MEDFTHFNDQGRAKMVDVGEKSITHRTAAAAAVLQLNEKTFHLVQSGGVKKGDVLTVAQIAGIMGAKKTSELIPMCHPVPLQGIDLSLHLNEENLQVEIAARVNCDGKTGVEMEALPDPAGGPGAGPFRGGPDRLRYVQGGTEGYKDYRYPSFRENRRCSWGLL